MRDAVVEENVSLGEELVSRRGLDSICRMSDMSLWRRIKAGDFPAPVYVGRRRFWKLDELRKWVATRPTSLMGKRSKSGAEAARSA